jgi:site-specific recombinase XerD
VLNRKTGRCCGRAPSDRVSENDRQSGNRAGNWLTREQARRLLARPDLDTIEGKRNRAILAVLLGRALRWSELVALECRHIQPRDGRWVFVDLVG